MKMDLRWSSFPQNKPTEDTWEAGKSQGFCKESLYELVL
jgi:hypothetical protein